MKFIADRPFTDPEIAARKLLELANAFEPVQDGGIYIEKINWPMLHDLRATPAEYKAGSTMPSPRVGFGCTRAGPT
jgi:hypothetical protein